MTEPARMERNRSMLAQCHPVFQDRVVTILVAMQGHGFRPRIQQSARSIREQEEAFNSGNSQLTYGFHNVVDKDGHWEALAVDVLDDDAPLNPGLPYLLALAIEANKVKCQTGITWGLPILMKDRIYTAIRNNDTTVVVKIGWDPCHIEPIDVTIHEAKLGKRPQV